MGLEAVSYSYTYACHSDHFRAESHQKNRLPASSEPFLFLDIKMSNALFVCGGPGCFHVLAVRWFSCRALRAHI